MILNPTAPSIVLNDASGNAKTTIRTGALQGLTSEQFNVGYFTITSPAVQIKNDQSGVSYTYSADAVSLGSLVSGLYNASYSYNYTITPGTIVQVDAQTSGQASYTQGVNIIDTNGYVVGAFTFGSGQSTNYIGSNTVSTNNMGQMTGYISITIPSNNTYYARPWYSYVVNASGNGYSRILSKSSNTPSLTFTKVTGFSELTDEGLQIVSSTSRYIKMQTGGVYDLESQGSWYHTGGDVNLCTSSGTATVAGAKIAVQGGTYPSDERLKEDISNFTNGLDTIKKLNPKWFRFKNRMNDLFDAGVIAQEVQPNIPEFIGVRPDGFFGVNYDAIHMTMVNAIKELSNKIDELEAKISGSI